MTWPDSMRRPRSWFGCRAKPHRAAVHPVFAQARSHGSTICAGPGVIRSVVPSLCSCSGATVTRRRRSPRDVLPFLAAHDADCPWAVCAFGPRESACVLTAAGLGGHVRVGFENNLRLADGRLATSNAELVAQVTAGARLLGREVADIATARAFLCRGGGLARISTPG